MNSVWQPACTATTRAERDPVTRLRVPVYAACVLLCLCVNYALGNDIAWDTINHHIYAGFSALHDRFSQDYFAAGPQGYLNPYAYVPFYGLIAAGLTALQASSLLAVVHSVFLWLVYELGVRACPSAPARTRTAIGLCALFLAALNATLLDQVGTSFSDITTGTLVLAAWLLLVRTIQVATLVPVLLAGALLGAATALKLSNATHAVAATGLLLWLQRPWSSRFRFAAGYVAAVGFAFVAVSAPWSYRLWRQFGNPLFPMLNNVFRSPDFTTQPQFLLRFVPANLLEALWRPFALANPVAMVHYETIRPDVRYAVLVVLGIVLLARWLRRRVRGAAEAAPPTSPDTGLRPLSALGCGLILDWILWLASSGNARYFLPMAAVAAVVLVALLFQLLAPRPKARNYVLAAILGTQLAQTCLGSDYRWDPVPWNGPWLEVSVPPALTAEPNLFLTSGAPSDSFLAPYLPAGSGMINFSGAYVLGPEGASGERIRALLHRYGPHVRVLVAGARFYTAAEARAPTRKGVDQLLARFSLRIDPSDCQTIWAHGLPPPLEFGIAGKNTPPSEQDPADASPFLTCRVVNDPEGYQRLMAEKAPVDTALDHVEDACPQLLQARRPPLTEHVASVWRRVYYNTDLAVWVFQGEVTLQDTLRGDDPIDLGRESDWEKAPLKLVCGRRDGHYFARPIPALTR
jgi:Glycosyltransferase family 87